MNTKKNIGPLWIILGSLAFSTLGTAQALAPEEAAPYVIGTVRVLGGGLILLAWCAFRNLLPTRHGWWRIEVPICIIGLLGFQAFYFQGISQVGVAIGAVTALGVTPIATGLFCMLFLREPPTLRWLFSTLLAIAGLVMISLTGNTSLENTQGLMLTILAGIFYSANLIASKRLLEVHHPATLTMVLILGTGLCMLPFVFLHPLSWIFTLHGLAISLHFSIITVAFAFVILNKGLQLTPAPTAATLNLTEPLGATLLGVFFLGESLSFAASIGIFCIFLAVFGLILPVSFKKNIPKDISAQ